MAHSSHQAPRSCDFLDLVVGVARHGDSGSTAGQGRGFLVWLIDDQDTVVVRAAATLSDAAEVARAYRAGWGGDVRFIEGPNGEIVDRTEWEPLAESAAPLPYVYTVELRSPRAAGHNELLTALWTSTDLDEALRWRSLLPDGLRGRTLVVSNAPDGQYPNPHRRHADH